MATKSWLITVSVLVEEDEEVCRASPGLKTDDDIREAVIAVIAQRFCGLPGTQVEWQSMSSVPLDGKPHCGRCAVCNCWVYDVESRTADTPTGICGGAVVDGQLLCDEHLPEDHPVAF